jgi:hypothetical protein
MGLTASDPITGAVSIAAALESQSKAVSNLSMHSQRLSRQFETTVTQLRMAQEKQGMNTLLDIMERETYHPSADRFIFSEPEIVAALRARTRERLASEASQ